jgi:curved DNA-binding protein
MKNYYEILGVGRDVDPDGLKKAFRKLARRYHPDVNPGNKEAEARFKIVNEAYNTLSDPSLKMAYDAKLEGNIDRARPGASAVSPRSSYQPINFANVNRNFESFFGFNPKTGETTGLKREKRKNPPDTTTVFEKYFPVKRK